MFPPHTRGCTVGHDTEGRFLLVSPAHAGMYPLYAETERRPFCFPRTRGDVPIQEGDLWDIQAFPPHTRGCTRCLYMLPKSPRVSPAHAGMYRLLEEGSRSYWCFPRTRGDVPVSVQLRHASTGHLPWVCKFPERMGRNPQTGQPIRIPARRAVKFSAGKALKDAI